MTSEPALSTTSEKAHILGAPREVCDLAARFDLEAADIDGSPKWSAQEKARQLDALRSSTDAALLAAATAEHAPARRELDQREGLARAAARGTLPGTAADATKAMAKMTALTTLRTSAAGATTAGEALLAVEDAELTEDADVIRAVLTAAHARAVEEERATPADQRQRPGGIAWTAAKMDLAARLRRFTESHPSPAEVLRQVAQQREALQQREARHLDAWRELFGLGPMAATARKFPGWRI